MDINLFRGIFTVVMFAIFIGICIWAWSKKRDKDFHDAANLPFADDQAEKNSSDKLKESTDE